MWNQADEDPAEMSLIRKMGQFRKISSVESPVDLGNKVVAIRRLALIVDDYDSNQEPAKRKINYVEIELFSEVAPPVLNTGYIVRIGSREFLPGGRGCGTNPRCVMVVITPVEFESLNDGDLISMRNGIGATSEELATMFENGEPPTVVGAKFGRLRKSVISNFPPIERTATDH